MNNIEQAIEKIRSVGKEICSSQKYDFADFDHGRNDATAVCKRLGIPYTDDLFLEYPAERLFAPIDRAEIEAAERRIGVALPEDYKALMETFGACNLPGDATVGFWSPMGAYEITRHFWCYEGTPLTVLAISSFHDTADGDAIGFLREGERFRPEVFKFDHGNRHDGDDPKLWSTKLADSLSDFVIEYLDRPR